MIRPSLVVLARSTDCRRVSATTMPLSPFAVDFGEKGKVARDGAVPGVAVKQ